MQIFLITAATVGLVLIFLNVLKRVIRSQRVKVAPIQEAQVQSEVKAERATTKSFNDSLSWKRQKVDYKALNTAYNRADLDLAKNDLKAAEQGFVKVISMKPDHADANNRLGLIYIKQGQNKKAEAVYQSLTEYYPDKAIYFSNLGRVLYNQKKLEQAAQAYEMAVGLDSRRLERYLSLGQVYRELKAYKRAVSSFSKALDLNPRQEELYFLIVDLLDQIEGYNEGIAYLKAMLEIYPYNQKAKDLIIDFKRKMHLSPLNSEQEAQKRKAKINQKTLFKNVDNSVDARAHQDIAKESDTQKIEPSPNQISIDDMN